MRRVLMLGWEFPPHISGGLGTACEGLAGALAAQGVALTFAVPHLTGDEDAPYMALVAPTAAGVVQASTSAPHVSSPAPDPDPVEAPAGPTAPAVDGTTAPAVDEPGANARPPRAPGPPSGGAAAPPAPEATRPSPSPPRPAVAHVPSARPPAAGVPSAPASDAIERAVQRVTIVPVPSALSPYLRPEAYLERMLARRRQIARTRSGSLAPSTDPTDPLGGELADEPDPDPIPPTELARMLADVDLVGPDVLAPEDEPTGGDRGAHYGGDLFEEVGRYARRCARLAMSLDFELVHAHDWMTFPAALLIGQLTGKPVVLHVHSLEYDRSGAHPHPRIDAIERAGVHAADRVIAVSHYTKAVIVRQHGVDAAKVEVVHNGIAHKDRLRTFHQSRGPRAEKTVLFLGRVTFQKGPDYFVEAAAQVIPHYPKVRFVVAGTGDMLPRLVERVAQLGLSRYFHFTGFVKGQQLELMFSIADVYVMPSVSEPFGIAPLEALVRDTPVIISKQSGVSEVLRHALRVDFWDTRRLAELIISVLRYPAIGRTMTALGVEELLALRWDSSAMRVRRIYDDVLES